MYDQPLKFIKLYLPLLTNSDMLVRQHTSLILLGVFGDRAFTYLRRLSGDADLHVREEARLAMLALAETTDRVVKVQSFKGMHIECLGPLRVYIGNHEMQDSDWAQTEGGRAGAQKVKGAFAYLVHCGRRGSSREAFGAAIWEGKGNVNGLSRTLSTLRQALARYDDNTFMVERSLILGKEYCLLDPSYYHTDVLFLEQAFDIAERIEQEQGLSSAVPFYRSVFQVYYGPYMADVPLGNGWSKVRREQLLSTFVLAAERLAEYNYTNEAYAQCINICSLTLDTDPTADEIVVWLLRAFAQSRRYAELENAYRNYLRIAQINISSNEGQQDLVVQLYQSLR